MSNEVGTSKINLLRLSDKEEKREDDLVAREAPISIEVNGKRFVTLLATPTDLKELACGFLFSGGLIERIEDISSIKEMAAEVKIEVTMIKESAPEGGILTSSCGRGILLYGSILDERVESDLCIFQDSISSLMREFQGMSNGFKATGGVHSAGLSDGKKILDFKEDIGRHNAIDKIIGHALLEGITLKDKIILTSGRITSDAVTKAVRAHIPIIISRASPTDLAIELAQNSGVTLVGFARGKRMNIYTHERRIRRKNL